MKYLKNNRYGLCALAIIIFAVLLRLLLLSLGWPSSNSDEGTMGIMARHIAYNGEHPILFYGQSYMGAIEAYLAALFFHLFGPSLFTLRLAPLFLFSLFLASMYLLTSVLYTKEFALVVLLLLSLGSSAMFLRELYATGGSTQTLLFGSLAFLIATWLALSRGQVLSPGKRWLRYACYVGWGLVVGLGLWSDLIVFPYLVMSALFLLLFCWPDGRSWAPLCLLLGFVTGVFPMIAYNILAPSGQNSIFVLLGLFHGSQMHTSLSFLTLVTGVKATLQVSIPTATGIPACPVPALRYENNVNPPNTQCLALYTGWGVGYLLLWTVATFLTLQALWTLRPHYRFLKLARATAKHEVITAHFARFFLLASAGLALISYAISSAPLSLPASHARYLVGLLIVTPAVLWPLWRAASPIFRSSRRGWPFQWDRLWGWHSRRGGRGEERSGDACVAQGEQMQRNRTKGSAWLSAGILLLIGSALLAGTIGISGEFPATQAFNQRQDALIHDLLRMRTTHIYTDYWTCDRIAFISNEQIICGVIGTYLQPTHNRETRYWLTVSSDPHSAYVLPPDHSAIPALEKMVAAAGGDRAYQRLLLDGYVVYIPR